MSLLSQKCPMTLITKEFCAQLIFVLFKRNQKLCVLTGLEIRLTLEVDGNVSPGHLAESRALEKRKLFGPSGQSSKNVLKLKKFPTQKTFLIILMAFRSKIAIM